jgi:hypothetical protein
MTRSEMSPYQGREVAFLTQHGKQHLMRDPLLHGLSCHLVHTDAFDTDQLGTFTNEVVRHGSQLDAVREKARLGMNLTGLPIGIASEGAFGPDPFVGFTPWNSEVVLWVDQELGIEVQGFAHGPAQSLQRAIKTLDELSSFANEANFPNHYLSLRPEEMDYSAGQKGICDASHLAAAFQSAQSRSASGWVVIENDLRAFSNPTRQALIRKAMDNLIQKLLSACPQCTKPGFSLTKKVPGLPCRACARPTQLAVEEIWRCTNCSFEAHKPILQPETADPARCNYCNP